MNLEDSLRELSDDELRKRAASLQGKAKLKKGRSKRANKKAIRAEERQQEVALINGILADRLAREQEKTRKEVVNRLTGEAVSAMRIDDLPTRFSIERELAVQLDLNETQVGLRIIDAYAQEDNTVLSYEETRSLYEQNFHAARLFSGRLDFADAVSWNPYNGVDDLHNTWANDDTTSSVYTFPPEKASEVQMDNELVDLFQNTAVIKQVPVTKTTASIVALKAYEYLFVYHNSRSSQSGDDYLEIEKFAKHEALKSLFSFFDYVTQQNQRRTYSEILDSFSEHYTKEALLQSAEHSLHSFLGGIIDKLDFELYVTRGEYGYFQPPRSIEEALERIHLHCCALSYNSNVSSGQDFTFSPEELEKFIPAAKLMIDRTPEYVGYHDAEANELLDIQCPGLREDRDVYEKLMVFRAAGRLHIVNTDVAHDAVRKHLSRRDKLFVVCADRKNIVYPDMRVATSEWKKYRPQVEGIESPFSFPLCTMEELERYFFASESIAGRYLPQQESNLADVNEKEEEISVVIEQSETPDWHPLTRMKALRRALLREQVHATYSYDETESPNMQDYGKLGRGHYAVVTVADLNLQIIISDDPQLGCYQVFNNNSPIDYTHVELSEISQMGATPIRWHDADQFARSIRTSISQQREHPITVFPVHESVAHVPIDNLLDNRNESLSREHLQYDLERVAQLCRKEEAPWTLKVGNFSDVRSGEILWSFGGNSDGITYLNRVGRRMGLDNRDAAEELDQRDLAAFTLRWILRTVYPDQTSPIMPRPEDDEF